LLLPSISSLMFPAIKSSIRQRLGSDDSSSVNRP
jgi:hypothetical protein